MSRKDLRKTVDGAVFANSIQLNGTEAGNKKKINTSRKLMTSSKKKGKGIGKPKVCQQQNTGSGNGSGKT